MDSVKRQYEAYPYPARDPAEEATRLIEGSPSHPHEIDHFIFGGRRDWTQPFRALVAGGGTGDGLIMLAQKLADLGCPAEITYIDMSSASREIAEARAKARGLAIRFITGDLLTAPDHGPFDYIDCCGVLHHLPDPDAGFSALAEALADGGGMGLMVYAPYGRSGVYPLQDAFGALFADEAPDDQITMAKAAFNGVPDAHPFKRNVLLGDHRDSDAGFYDLLLHSRDRAYTVTELSGAIDRAGLGVVSFLEPARYDPMQYLPKTPEMVERVKALSPIDRMAVAEKLSGTLKTHVVYAAQAKRASKAEARPSKPDLIPHVSGAPAQAIAQAIAKQGGFTADLDGVGYRVDITQDAAKLIAGINGQRTLGDLAQGADWMAFAQAWGPIHRGLTGMNFLHYSIGAKR